MKRKAERTVHFVSPAEFQAETKINFSKTQSIKNYNKLTKDYTTVTDIISIEKEQENPTESSKERSPTTSKEITKFCLPENINYISVRTDDDLYVIDIKKHGFTESFQDRVRQVWTEQPKRMGLILGNLHILEVNVNSMFIQNKPIIIPEEIQSEITRINNLIRCINCRISFDYGYNSLGGDAMLNSYSASPCDLLLCLFHNDICISSIEIILNSFTHVSINSFTNPDFEGAGINQLLRAVAVLIAPKISPTIEFLESSALNPVSARILINKLNGYEEVSGLDLSIRPVPFETIQKYISSKLHDEVSSIMSIIVNVKDPVTIAAAERLIEEVTKSEKFKSVCRRVDHGKGYRRAAVAYTSKRKGKKAKSKKNYSKKNKSKKRIR